MWQKIVDKALDKAVSQDFWRGAIYTVAGAWATANPTQATAALSVAVLVSGIIHTIWHSKYPNASK